MNYLLKDFKTAGNVLRPVDWTMAYDNMIDDYFPGISEVRSAWANQKAGYWNRMFDKGSHWSSINGLQSRGSIGHFQTDHFSFLIKLTIKKDTYPTRFAIIDSC